MEISDWCPKLFNNKNTNSFDEMKKYHSKNTNIIVKKFYASPIWNYHPKKMDVIRWLLCESKSSLSLIMLSDQEISTRKAQWIHNLFAQYNHIDKSEERQGELYYMYIETYVEYTQFTVLDNTGNEERVIRINVGYCPEKNQLFKEIGETLYEEFSRQIDHIIFYGSIFHFVDGCGPTYFNSMNKFVFETYGIDYAHFGFVPQQFYTTKTIVVDDQKIKEEDIKTFYNEYKYFSKSDNEFYIVLTDRAIEVFSNTSNQCFAIHYYPTNWLYNDEGFEEIIKNLKKYVNSGMITIPI